MFNIVIAGVGGQGTLLASKILGTLSQEHGYDVRVSEVHGMSQRGGSVITYVRMSRDERVYSSIVEQGMADVLLAFESLEALRNLPYVKPGGTAIVNTQEILPMPVITGAAQYPQDCLERVKEKADIIALDAAGIARECGTHRAANTVLLGVLAQKLPFSREDWHAAIEKNVKPAFFEINKAAFDRGYGYGITVQ
jgi:indolepyruvate ferredoxin oxidoreductase beta subunit